MRGLCRRAVSVCLAKCLSRWRTVSKWVDTFSNFLSASLYVSKRGAYWDRLCRDVVGRWLVGRWSLVGWLVVTRVHCGQTVHPRPIVTIPRNSMVQLSNPGVTPNRGMGPREALFVKLLWPLVSPSGRPTNLVLPYSDTTDNILTGGGALTGASNAGRIWKISIFDQYLALFRKWYKIGPIVTMKR